MLRRDFLALSLTGATGLAGTGRTWAQDAAADYPNKPVTIIVPFAAGGNTDAFARIVAQELDAAFNQRFLVENKAGAGGNIGVGQLARAEPDGYTLGMGTASTHGIGPAIYKDLPFDYDTAFAPISLFVTLPNVLAVNPDRISAKTVPEFIELLKAEPDTYTFASSGIGTSPHLAGELFMAKTGTKMIHVPYKSSGQVMLDLVAGHVDIAFDNIPIVAQQVQAGKVWALAVTSLERAPLLPDVPPMNDFVPGYEANTWHGLFVPAGTPQPIIDKLAKAVQQILHAPKVSEQLIGMGTTPVGNTPVEFAEFIRAEREKWAEVVKIANIQLQ